MKLTRKMQFKTNDIFVGDQITVKLDGFGKFTATVQKVTDDAAIFLFDDIVARHTMNEGRTNEGGFDNSDLKKWLEEVLLPAFPKKLRCRIGELTIPTYGEIFGHDDYYENFEPDEDEQFESMRRRGNRVCDFEDDWCWWWLRNATKKELSAAYFAYVGNDGNAYSNNASASRGVRPVLSLVR